MWNNWQKQKSVHVNLDNLDMLVHPKWNGKIVWFKSLIVKTHKRLSFWINPKTWRMSKTTDNKCLMQTPYSDDQKPYSVDQTLFLEHFINQ